MLGHLPGTLVDSLECDRRIPREKRRAGETIAMPDHECGSARICGGRIGTISFGKGQDIGSVEKDVIMGEDPRGGLCRGYAGRKRRLAASGKSGEDERAPVGQRDGRRGKDADSPLAQAHEKEVLDQEARDDPVIMIGKASPARENAIGYMPHEALLEIGGDMPRIPRERACRAELAMPEEKNAV